MLEAEGHYMIAHVSVAPLAKAEITDVCKSLFIHYVLKGDLKFRRMKPWNT